MDIWFRFVVAALAVWRLAFLLAREDGPGGMFTRWRNKLGRGFFGQLLSCVKCVGVWLAFPFAFYVRSDWEAVGMIWLALAGVTALIDELTRPPFEWRDATEQELLSDGGKGDGRPGEQGPPAPPLPG